MQLAQKFGKSIGFNEARQNALTKDLQKGFSQSSSSELSDAWGFNSSEQIVQSTREATKASQQFTQLDQASKNIGLSWKVPANVLGAELVKQGLESSLSEQMRYAPNAVRQQAAQTTNRYINGMNMQPDVAQAAANLIALTQNNPNDVTGIIGQAAGANLQGIGDANRYSGIGGLGQLNATSFEEPQSLSTHRKVYPNEKRPALETMTWTNGEMNTANVPQEISTEHGTNTANTQAHAQDNAVDNQQELQAMREILTWNDQRSLPERAYDTVKSAQKGFLEEIGLKDTSGNTAGNMGFVSFSMQERFGLSPATADYFSARVLDLPEQAEHAGVALDEEWGKSSPYRGKVKEILDSAADNPEVMEQAIRPLVKYYGVAKPFEMQGN
ncbi:hypothetical protein [Pseudovibrio sp. Ad37]|uniref:hypothetical protein n=1 Tax=Pseudovibrio sp. Ad37 TaxID=989422 RepID=UPI0007B2C3F8|nr:hypothetical protein [Pseudovibrio sp. Ad37]KZL19913.1 hypothetical protein PsAD37_03634 [Pseudovibrio sp. Ad37]